MLFAANSHQRAHWSVCVALRMCGLIALSCRQRDVLQACSVAWSVCVCVYGGRLLRCSECWSALCSGDVTLCDVTRRGGRLRERREGRTDKGIRHVHLWFHHSRSLAHLTEVSISFRSDKNMGGKKTLTCTTSLLLTSTAIAGWHGNSHRPNHPHSCNTHTHIIGNTTTTSPTHSHYFMSVSCRLSFIMTQHQS